MERKFTIFALFCFVLEGKFQVQATPGGLIFGGAYTWRGLFSEFYGIGNNIIIFINYCLSNQIPFDLSVTFET